MVTTMAAGHASSCMAYGITPCCCPGSALSYKACFLLLFNFFQQFKLAAACSLHRGNIFGWLCRPFAASQFFRSPVQCTVEWIYYRFCNQHRYMAYCTAMLAKPSQC